MNSIASVVNFINFDVNVAGYTNIVNHRILSAHSVESIDHFDPSALLRGEACIKLKSDTYGGAPLREFLAQFNLIARANHWKEEIKTAVLVSCYLRARTVLESM